MAIYSPSATMTYARCPQMWQFYREGWQPKHVGRLDIAAACGVGFAKAMEVWFKGAVYPPTDEGVEAAQHYIHARIEAGGITSWEHPGLTAVYEKLPHAITNFTKKWKKPSDWHTFSPELVFPDQGNCRVDLLCESAFGPCIIDFKTKISKPAPYVMANFITAQEYSWQFYHYIWAARQNNIDVGSFAVIVVSFEPFNITQEQWVVDEEYLKQWADAARMWWHKMDDTKARGIYEMSPDHTDKYGLCRYSETCLQGDRLYPIQWERNMIHVSHT